MIRFSSCGVISRMQLSHGKPNLFSKPQVLELYNYFTIGSAYEIMVHVIIANVQMPILNTN